MDDGKVRERVRLARGTAPRAIADGAEGGDSEATRPIAQPTSDTALAQTDPVVAEHAATAGDEPARTINEAVERLIRDQERDDAVAEWAHARA